MTAALRDRPATEEQIETLCASILAIKEEQRDLWRDYDYYAGALLRYMADRDLKAVEFHGHTFRRLTHKPTGSPSARKRWRSLYPACVSDLRISFPKPGTNGEAPDAKQ